MTKPIDITVEEIDGKFYKTERTPEMIVPRTLLCCGKCQLHAVEMEAYFDEETSKTRYRRPAVCPGCGEPIDWAAWEKDREEGMKRFKEFFDKNAKDGTLVMLNEEGTGYLQEGWEGERK